MRATPQASAGLMVSVPENYRCRLIARRGAGCCPIPPGGRMFLFGVSMSKHSCRALGDHTECTRAFRVKQGRV